MAFVITSFNYDDTGKRVNVTLAEGSDFMNCNFVLHAQETETIEALKKRALMELPKLVERALHDALHPAKHPHGH